jgi:nucleoid DNA-binding protein
MSTNYLVAMYSNKTKLQFTYIRVNIYCPFINHSKEKPHMAVKKKVKPSTKRSNKSKAQVASLPLKAIPQKQTKMQILKNIADHSGLPVKQVKAVLTAAGHIAKCHIIKKGSGEFAIPEMAIKVVRKTKPATKQRQGRNPMTGEAITIAAKPKRDVIKVRPLKSLKEAIMQG